MDIRENLDFSEENKELRKTIQQITNILCDELYNEKAFHMTYREGIAEALSIITKKCGVSIEEIRNPMVR